MNAPAPSHRRHCPAARPGRAGRLVGLALASLLAACGDAPPPTADDPQGGAKPDEAVVLTGVMRLPGAPVGLTDPTWHTAEELGGIPADMPVLVVGDGEARRALRVPALEVDHVVNVVVGERPLAVTWCVECDAGVVFEARLPDHPRLQLFAHQSWQGSMLLHDKETGSVWRQIDGVCIAGPLRGKRLAMVDDWRIRTWSALATRHPDLRVAAARDESAASNQFRLSEGGATNPLLDAIRPAPDGRLDNRASVIGWLLDEAPLAMPVALLETAGHVGGCQGDVCYVVIAPPAPDRPRVFSTRVNGRNLVFAKHPDRKHHLRDDETGTTWSHLGEAVDGPLQGTQLERIPAVTTHWYAWRITHPGTQLRTE